MADAWEILYTNSTLPSGDAWEHLNNQQVGSGDVYIFGELDIELEMNCFDVELESDYDVYLDTDDISVEIEDNEYEIEVCS